MAWVLKMDETVEAGLVQDFDSSLTGIGQELGAAAYSMSDVLALPIFKEEESGLPLEAEAKQPPFQYILCAATSPAVKLHDESLTYLNQGQSYEIRMLDNRKVGDMPEITGKLVRSIIRVVFHDRRLQYTEHQQLEGWKWNRPGDRLLDLDIPVSVGVIDLRTNTDQLNAVEFLWDPAKRTSVFIQIHCISTEFTLRKHGGEKGVPFRVQIDTFKENDSGDYADHLHSASCQIKVFKPKGADRKQKTDREKMEKRTAHEKEKYQPSYDTTILSECSPWPVTSAAYSSDNPAPAPTASTSQHSTHSAPESTATSSSHPGEGIVQISNELLHPSATIQETQQWLLRNRFASYGRLFVNFAGADLLKLTRDDLIQICGAADGIRLDNILKARTIRPRLTMYVCQEQPQVILPENPADGGQGDHGDGAIYIYHAICLEEVTASEVMQKLACTFNVPLHQIHHVFRRGPTGIHILLSDQVVQNFPDESCFFFATIKAENGQGFHIILK